MSKDKVVTAPVAEPTVTVVFDGVWTATRNGVVLCRTHDEAEARSYCQESDVKTPEVDVETRS